VHNEFVSAKGGEELCDGGLELSGARFPSKVLAGFNAIHFHLHSFGLNIEIESVKHH
jgi:hypothetical protein